MTLQERHWDLRCSHTSGPAIGLALVVNTIVIHVTPATFKLIFNCCSVLVVLPGYDFPVTCQPPREYALELASLFNRVVEHVIFSSMIYLYLIICFVLGIFAYICVIFVPSVGKYFIREHVGKPWYMLRFQFGLLTRASRGSPAFLFVGWVI